MCRQEPERSDTHSAPDTKRESGNKLKRFWWTKRIAIAYALLIVAMLLTRCVWGHVADRRAASVLAEYEARNICIDWKALEPEPIPDQENAAFYHKRAAAALKNSMTPDQARMLDDLWAIPSFRAKHVADADAIIAANAAALADCRTARPLTQANWGMRHTSPAINAINWRIPFGDIRELVRFLCLTSVRQMERGQIADAVQTLRDAQAVCRTVGDGTLLLGHMVSVNCHGLVCRCVEQIASQLHSAADSPDAKPLSDPTARKSVRLLMADLLDKHPLASERNGFIAEIANIYNTVDYLVHHHGDWKAFGVPPARSAGLSQITNWASVPMWRAAQARLLERFLPALHLFGQGTRTQIAEALSLPYGQYAQSSGINSLPDMLFNILLPSYSQGVQNTRETEAERRMAAAALALGLYAHQHGNRPASLDALVGEYLSQVPIDPTDPNEGPIRALLTGDKPRLYCVGDNMIDNGGKFSTGCWPVPDVVFFLEAGDRPEGQVEYDADQQDAGEGPPEFPGDPESVGPPASPPDFPPDGTNDIHPTFVPAEP